MNDQQEYTERQVTIESLYWDEDCRYMEKREIEFGGEFRLIDSFQNTNGDVYDGFYYVGFEGHDDLIQFESHQQVKVRLYPEMLSDDDEELDDIPPTLACSPDWQVGDRVETTKPLNSVEGEVPVGTQGKLIDITSGGWRYWIEWDNGVLDNYDYFKNSPGHGIIKIADAIISKMAVYQTKTLSGIAGSLDQSIADYLNDGWSVAFETTNISDYPIIYHTVRLQRETSGITPTPPTSPIDNLRVATEALIEDEDGDDPEPPAPTIEEPVEHNPTLFLTAPDPVQSHINAINAKIDRLLVTRYQEITNKYAGWKPTPFTMVAV